MGSTEFPFGLGLILFFIYVGRRSVLGEVSMTCEDPDVLGGDHSAVFEKLF